MYKALIVDDEFWALQGVNNIIPWLYKFIYGT